MRREIKIELEILISEHFAPDCKIINELKLSQNSLIILQSGAKKILIAINYFEIHLICPAQIISPYKAIG